MLLLICGYAVLSLQSRLALWFAAALLIVGNSFFKPSAQGVLSHLYVRAQSRLGAAQIWFRDVCPRFHRALHLGSRCNIVLQSIQSA